MSTTNTHKEILETIQKDLVGRSESQDKLCSIDLLPTEILEYHILGYFWFQYWIDNFLSVCKRWKQICENTNIAPKHMRITASSKLDLGQAILMIRKYNPSILELNLHDITLPSRYTIPNLVGAGESIDTLIIDHYSIIADNIAYTKALDNVRTLVWRGQCSPRICTLFPKLQRLQTSLNTTFWQDNLQYNVDDLTIMYPESAQRCVEELTNPKLTIIDGKVIQKFAEEVKYVNLDGISYEQYFKYFGQTKLDDYVVNDRFADVAKLLETTTSMEYERDLHNRYFISYTYPMDTLCSESADFNNSFYDGRDHSESEVALQLLLSKKIPIDDAIIFGHMAYKGDVVGALSLLSKTGAEIMHSGYGHYVVDDFLRLIDNPMPLDAFNNENVLEAVCAIVKHCNMSRLKTKQQFDVIAPFVDWSETIANTNSVDLFWSTIEKGAEIPVHWLSNEAMKNNAIVNEILEELNDRDPSLWFDILLNASPARALLMMEKYNVPPTIEKNGKSLWSMWYRNGNNTKDLTVVDYINYMDSSGITPLLSVADDFNWDNLQRLLQLGADPNLHRKDKLSPIATALLHMAKTHHRSTHMILVLLEYGADFNAPCLYEDRMCSPLMIAVLACCELVVIKLMIALGAETKYCDENGRSIKDCAIERRKHYKDKDFQTLMWLLSSYTFNRFTYARLDVSGTQLVLPCRSGASPNWISYVYTVNSAELVDVTSLPTNNRVIVDAQVYGLDVWVNYETSIAYATRGAQVASEANIMVNDNPGISTTQLIGTKLYAVVNGDLQVMDPVVRFGTGTFTKFISSVNIFYFFDSTTVYTTEIGDVVKYVVDQDGQPQRAYSIAGGTPRGLFAMEVNGVRYVLFNSCQFGCKLHRVTDTGSAFTDDTILDEFVNFGDIRSVTGSPRRTCTDKLKNQDETDVDCGGMICSACDNDKACLVPSDCTSSYCNPDLTCSTPSCSDGYINQDETDIECGGTNCLGCAVGKSCKTNADCKNNLCTANVCQNPPPVAAPVAQSPQSNSPVANSPSSQPSSNQPASSNQPGSNSNQPSSTNTPAKKGVSAGSVIELSLVGLTGLIILALN